MTVLDRHVPLKKRLRANHSSYISKTLRKAIMTSSYLKKKYFLKKTNKTDQSLRAYKK